MPELFRPGMAGKMLCACCRLEEFSVALKPFDESAADRRGKERILAAGLLPSSPAGIAENVNVRRPVGEPLIYASVAETLTLIVFCPTFGRNSIRDLADKRGIEACREGDRLRKNGRKGAGSSSLQRSFGKRSLLPSFLLLSNP